MLSCSAVLQVCVPFSCSTAADFDPDAVPTVQQLLEELGPAATPAGQPPGRPVDAASEWSSTALAGCMTMFCRYAHAAVRIMHVQAWWR